MNSYESALDRDPGARYRRNTLTGEVERVDIDGVGGDPLLTQPSAVGPPTAASGAASIGDHRDESLTGGLDNIGEMVARVSGKPPPRTRVQRLADWLIRVAFKGTKADRARRRREAVALAGPPDRSRLTRESRRVLAAGRRGGEGKAARAVDGSRRARNRGR